MSTQTPVQTTEEGLWDANDVARYLKASTSYVYKAAERGDLPCRRIGAMLRFVPAAIRAFVRGEAAPTARVVPIGTRTPQT